ncbi:hypothetical protein HCN51_31600 [Nonomuraea sp. FMUSA5-5]|uniref:Uncharacterized protein n=1 Tax=Nonomuraea composti TaxID=2720023 RepID=A0ABX1B7Y7_9ACTN|nr:hypothetical protein [Nonomuraea sp. FMUSA5-5]NJP93930.1 hypothetical protein [Nonomuraea sp. FMUSA5-5]
MSAAADEVGVLVHELVPLLGMLWALVPEVGGSPMTGTMSHHKATGSPAPWNADAALLLYTISEEARRLEASLRRDVAGHVGDRRGGSDVNTVAALKAIMNLAYGVPERDARRAARIIGRWVRSARQVIGEEERAVPLPAAPGATPPPCPYCTTFSLRVVLRDGRLWCINDGCKDGRGRRPHGRMTRSDLNGDGMIEWDDGRITYRRDWA